VGRFCQYRLTLETIDGKKTPLIREVAVASTVPNLAPRVESVDTSRLSGPGKEGVFKISYKGSDSHAEWRSTLPDDSIGGTTEECFTIAAGDLGPGGHVIAVKITDGIGNTTLTTFDLDGARL